MLKKDDGRRLRGFHFMTLLRVNWFHFLTNEEISKCLEMVDAIVTTFKKRNFWLFRNICRVNDDRLLNIIMLGMVEL